jgi:hypothetical protein
MNPTNELVKIAKTLLASNALDGMNNVKAKRIVNDLLHSNTPSGMLRDDDWRHVDAIWKALTAAGIDYVMTEAVYHKGNDNSPTDKTWKFTVQFVNNNGRPTTLYGVVVAAFAGTVSDPTSAYDLVSYVS